VLLDYVSHPSPTRGNASRVDFLRHKSLAETWPENPTTTFYPEPFPSRSRPSRSQLRAGRRSPGTKHGAGRPAPRPKLSAANPSNAAAPPSHSNAAARHEDALPLRDRRPKPRADLHHQRRRPRTPPCISPHHFLCISDAAPFRLLRPASPTPRHLFT
jgi:hypothetical protein